MNIANKITQLKTESLNDTLSLIHHDTLQKAVRALQKSNTVNKSLVRVGSYSVRNI